MQGAGRSGRARTRPAAWNARAGDWGAAHGTAHGCRQSSAADCPAMVAHGCRIDRDGRHRQAGTRRGLADSPASVPRRGQQAGRGTVCRLSADRELLRKLTKSPVCYMAVQNPDFTLSVFLKKRKGKRKVKNFSPLILLGFVRFALSASGNHAEMRGYRLKAPRWARRTT